MRSGRRRFAAGLIGTATMLACVTPQAHGAAGFSASCEPTTINYPALTQITCTLVVTTGDQEERFSVSPRAPQFGGEGMDAEFATLSSNGRLTLVGPGELGLGAYAFPSVAACSFLERGWHGAVNGSGKTDVAIPPDSQASLVATYQAQEPPWPRDSLAPLFEISNEMVSGDESTLPAPLTVRTAEPARTGVSGVRIVFATRPESGRRPGPATRIEAGKEIVIKGYTEPAVRKQLLKLQMIGPIRPRTRSRPTKAPVRTDKRGHFRLRIDPEIEGSYEIATTYNSKRPLLADGYTCARAFTLVK